MERESELQERIKNYRQLLLSFFHGQIELPNLMTDSRKMHESFFALCMSHRALSSNRKIWQPQI